MQQALSTARTPVRPSRPQLAPRARASPASVVLRACRPRQWLKNGLVVLAPAAAGTLTQPAPFLRVGCAFVAFCLLSSATYLINDVRDRNQDRLHPRKRYRPVAAGELHPRGALRIAALMALAGLCVAMAVRPQLGLIAAGYIALTTSYSICFRHVVLADILAVAAGFVLRAAGGASAAGVGLSRAFVIVISACALFIVVGKRYAELGAPRPSRATLRRYSRRGLRALLSAAATLACFAYAWWALASPPSLPRAFSMVPFMLWLGRYRSLVRTGAGEAPEELVLHDPGLLALGLMWATLFAAGVYR
jgi:decaprenyl-phosphate phosphoribosyltransferase